MDNKQFSPPVPIFDGLDFPHSVATLWEAFAMLNAWPAYGRDATHEAALDACRDAMAGECDVETARAKVLAFARSTGILAYEARASHTTLRVELM
jgi:hypothetical protein